MKIHFTKQGESLYEVAERYNVGMVELLAYNQQIEDPTSLQGGMQINIPSLIGLDGLLLDDSGKGNVCADVLAEPVEYIKPKGTHLPSQDYTHPRPVAHTAYLKDEQAPIYPLQHQQLQQLQQQHAQMANYYNSRNYPQYYYPINYYNPNNIEQG